MPASDAGAARACAVVESRGDRVAFCLHGRAATWALAAAAALAPILAFPPLNVWPAIVLGPALLAWLAMHATRGRRAVAAVLVAFTLAGLWQNRWLVDVTIAGYPLLGAYMALYPAMFVLLVRGVSRDPVLTRWPCVLVVPVAWTGLEFARGMIVMDGYAWHLVAHPLIAVPALVQPADLLGTYFVSFVAAAVAGALVDLARGLSGNRPRRVAWTGLGAVAALVAACLGYGAYRLGQADVLEPGPSVLLVQTNLPLDDKLDWSGGDVVDRQAADLIEFIDLTIEAVEREAAAGRRIDLVVWPETMLPGLGLEPDAIAAMERWSPASAQFAEAILWLQDQLGVPMLVGSNAYVGLDAEGERWTWERSYNAAYLVDGPPPFPRADKHVLTPFGETMPYISAWTWLEQRLAALGAREMSFDLDRGEIRRLELPREGRRAIALGTPICFEDTVGWVCRRMMYEDGRKRGDALINLSNSAWFGDSDETRAQHAQIARFRCIESRVPMARAANTGHSVAIDSRGNVVGRVGQVRYGAGRTSGALLAALPLDRRSTLYGRIGEAWGWICLAGTVGLLGRRLGRRRSPAGPANATEGTT